MNCYLLKRKIIQECLTLTDEEVAKWLQRLKDNYDCFSSDYWSNEFYREVIQEFLTKGRTAFIKKPKAPKEKALVKVKQQGNKIIVSIPKGFELVVA